MYDESMDREERDQERRARLEIHEKWTMALVRIAVALAVSAAICAVALSPY